MYPAVDPNDGYWRADVTPCEVIVKFSIQQLVCDDIIPAKSMGLTAGGD
jgi:hypothetical protein